MREASYRISESADGYDGYIYDRGEAPIVPTPAQQEFQRELDAAVRKNYQSLREIAEMSKAKPPGSYLFVKRVMDILVGVLALILLSPVFIVVAVLIKVDSRGAVLFKQERVGKDGRLFMMYKFRTMVADAERKTGPTWAEKNDPRLTFVGKFLRKSKIDEFPQFINLIKGDMTLVGPRPERPFFVDHFMERIPGYARRLDVTAGITGLAQLRNGYDQSALHVIRKLEYDIAYIKDMKLSMDLKLLKETLFSTLMGKL